MLSFCSLIVLLYYTVFFCCILLICFFWFINTNLLYEFRIISINWLYFNLKNNFSYLEKYFRHTLLNFNDFLSLIIKPLYLFCFLITVVLLQIMNWISIVFKLQLNQVKLHIWGCWKIIWGVFLTSFLWRRQVILTESYSWVSLIIINTRQKLWLLKFTHTWISE